MIVRLQEPLGAPLAKHTWNPPSSPLPLLGGLRRCDRCLTGQQWWYAWANGWGAVITDYSQGVRPEPYVVQVVQWLGADAYRPTEERHVLQWVDEVVGVLMELLVREPHQQYPVPVVGAGNDEEMERWTR